MCNIFLLHICFTNLNTNSKPHKFANIVNQLQET